MTCLQLAYWLIARSPRILCQRGDLAGTSTGPGMSLKRRFERRLGDAAGVVRDRGRGDRGDHFQEMIFAETGREESIDVLLIETSAFFDHRFRQRRQRSELVILR